jgi:anhydro-N-acetylmuramic acid kinase
MRTYKVIGVMSGTSMDGVDLAHCELTEQDNGKWIYKINAAKTYEYNDLWRLRLSKLRNQNALNVYKTDRYYGEYIGELINEFISDHNLTVDLIGCHGHTIFHQPEHNLTYQIGSVSAIAAVTDIPTVGNFRAMDVVKYGEGAPISGMGDQLLFSEFDMCLNLGGFANISGTVDGSAVAYDICPCNILLNRIAREFGKEYDEGGEIANKGSIDYDLLSDLNSIDYYAKPYPKSLGREWINEHFWYRVRQSEASKEDRMKTLVDHIAQQVAKNIELLAVDPSTARIYVTGGGAFNLALIDHLRTHSDAEIIVPDPQLVDYKEALIFGLLALLRVQNKTNILKSYTGAQEDSISGELAGNFSHLLI